MTTAVGRQLWTGVQSSVKTMQDSYRELDKTDKELLKLLQECSARLFSSNDQSLAVYLDEHRAKTTELRQQFFDKARSIEYSIEKARATLERPVVKSDAESEIEKLKAAISREQRIIGLKIEEWNKGTEGAGEKARQIRNDSLERDHRYRRGAGSILQLYENSKADKVNRLFELINVLKDNYTDDLNILREQLDSSKTKLKEAGMSQFDSHDRETKGFRSTSHQLNKRSEYGTLKDSSKNNSSSHLGYKGSSQTESPEVASKKLLNNLHAVINSVQEYKYECPVSTSEGDLLAQKLNSDLELAMESARRLTEIVMNATSSVARVPKTEQREGMRSLSPQNKTEEGSPTMNAANSIILSLQSSNRKLERKCEDRKQSLKKLYCIVVEKDRQLREACTALEKLKVGSRQLMENCDTNEQELNMKIDKLETKLSFISNIAKSIFEAFPYLQTDGSLEYSMTRRYEAIQRSILSGNKPEEGALQNRRSYESSGQLQIDVPGPEDQPDPLENLDETTANILQLARERFSFSADEDPDNPATTLVKIVKDWAYLIDGFAEALAAKEEALEAKTQLLYKLDERERIHAGVMRDLSFLKEERAKEVRELKQAEEIARLDAGKLREENEQLKMVAQVTTSSLVPEGLPPLKERSSSRELKRRKKEGTEDSSDTLARQIEVLKKENDRLKDKISIYSNGLEDKLSGVEHTLKEISMVKEWINQIKTEFNGKSIEILKSFKAGADKLGILKTLTGEQSQEVATIIAHLKNSVVGLEKENRDLKYIITSLEKSMLENKESLNLSLTTEDQATTMKERELEDSKIRVSTLEKEVELLRRQVVSMEESMSRAPTFEEVQPRMIDSLSPPRDSQLKSKVATLEEELRRYEEEVNLKERGLEETATKLAAAERLKDEMERELFTATNMLENLKSEAEEARGDVLRMEEEFNIAYNDNVEKDGKLKEADIIIEELNSRIKILSDNLTQARSDLDSVESVQKTSIESEERISRYQIELEDLKSKLNGSKKSLKEAEEELDRVMKQSEASYRHQQEKFDIELAEMKAGLQSLELMKAQLQTDHQTSVGQLIQEVKLWKSKFEEIEKQLSLSKVESANKERGYGAELSEISSKLNAKIEKLNKELENERSRNKELEATANKVILNKGDETSRLSSLINDLQTKVNQLTDENRAFEELLNDESVKSIELERLHKEESYKRESLQKKLEETISNLEAAQSELLHKQEQLESSKVKLSHEIKKTENLTLTHAETVKELKTRQAELEGELEEKEVEMRHCMENNLEKEELEQENIALKTERDRLALETQNMQNFVEMLRQEIKKYKQMAEHADRESKMRAAEVDEVRQKAVMEQAELSSTVKSEFEKVTTKIKEKDNQIEKLSEKISAQEKVIEGLQTSTNQSDAKIDELKKSLSSKEAALKSQTDSYKTELSEKNKDISNLNKTLSSLQRELDLGSKQTSELKSQLEAEHAKAKDFTTEISSLKNTLNSSDQKVRSLLQEIDQNDKLHADKIELLESEKTDIEAMYTEELQRLSEEVDYYKKDADHNLKDISNKDKELIRLKQAQDDLQIDIQQKTSQIQRLNGELEKKIVDSSGVLKAKDKFIVQLEAKVKNQDEEIEDLSNRLLSIDKKLQAAEEELETREGNRQALTENLDCISEDLSGKVAQIKTYEGDLKQLKKELAAVKEELNQEKMTSERNLELSNNKSQSIENLKKDIEKRKEEFDNCEGLLKKEKEITKAQAQALKDKESKLKEAAAKISQLSDDLQEASKKDSIAEKTIHDLKTSLSMAESKVASLTTKVSQLEKAAQEERSRLAQTQSAAKEQEEGVEFMRQSLERERSDRQKDLKNFEAELEKARDIATKETSTTKWIQGEKAKVEEKLRTVEGELMGKDKQIKVLEAEAKEKDENIGRMKGDLATLAARGTELEDALETLKSNHEEQKEAYTEALFEISNLEENLQIASSKLSEADTLFEQVEVYRRQGEMLNAELQEKETTIGAWQTKCRDLDLVVERLTSQMVRVKEERNQFDEHISEYKHRTTRAEESMANAITERNLERDERKSLKGLLDETQKQLSMLEAREQDRDRMLKEARDDLRQAEAGREEARNKLQKAEGEGARLTATITGFQTKFVDLQRENEGRKKRIEELVKELDGFKQKEGEELERIRSETASLDMDKNVMEGRIKELAASIESYRSKIETERENNIRLKIELEGEETKVSKAQTEIAKLREDLKFAQENPKIQYREVDSALLWKMFGLKIQIKELKRRYAVNLIVAKKSKPMVKQAKLLNKDNKKLAEELMSQTRKLIMLEKNRSEIEDQLTQKENELDQVIMVSRTLRSDTDNNVSARETTTEGGRLSETRAQQMKQVLRDLLHVIKDLLGLPIPPLDNLNHKQWDTYAQKFKSKLSETMIQVSDVHEMTETYKVLLDQQTQECERLREELRLKQAELGSPQFDKSLSIIEKNESMDKSKLNAFLNDTIKLKQTASNPEGRTSGNPRSVDVHLEPLEESGDHRYSSRDNEEGRESPIQYDMPATESERLILKSENLKLVDSLTALKMQLAEKEEEVADMEGAIENLKESMQEINLQFANSEQTCQQLRAAIREFAESAGTGADREARAWAEFSRVAGWDEKKSKDVKEKLAKALKKKGFF